MLIAAKLLMSQILDLAASLLESHPHIGNSEPGPAKGEIKDGEFKVRSQKLNDGSLIQPTKNVRNSISRILQKSGYEEVPIQRALQAFDSLGIAR